MTYTRKVNKPGDGLKYFNLRDKYLDWANQNPSINTPQMMSIYFTLLHIFEEYNSDEITFQSSIIMQLNSIASYNTYKKHFSSLVKNGFLIVVKKPINQYQSNTVKLPT